MKSKFLPTVTLLILLLTSCEQEHQTPDIQTGSTLAYTVIINGCEYLQYTTEMLCGHQYSHHTYNAKLLVHKGGCKNCVSKNITNQ